MRPLDPSLFMDCCPDFEGPAHSHRVAASRRKPHELNWTTLSSDTDAEAERIQMEIYRRMPAWRKIELIVEAIETARQLALAGLRSRHPEAGPEEIRRRLFGLLLGEKLAKEVYGPLPGRWRGTEK
jgi:hypothetical protein